LIRKPENDDDDPSEAGAKSGHLLQLDAEKTGEEVNRHPPNSPSP
jgi:hypothetical protein